jgi:iron complex outermembrane receptor protein
MLLIFFSTSSVFVSIGLAQSDELAAAGDEDIGLFALPFEQVMDIQITSSARRPQPISRSASAMYVITSEDIHQAGVTHLADLFRMVPGMDLAHVEGSSFAISARGFAKPASPRMQVLLDGRPLYDPFVGGVDFEIQPLFLENIERIEVIRGSGGVAWGVNAMNGVINIITKDTKDTLGGLGYGGFGNRTLQQGFLRYGGSDETMSWRGTTGAFNDRGFGTNHGKNVDDWFRAFQATGRADIRLDENTDLTLEGGHKSSFTGTEGDNFLSYSNLIWQKKLDDDSRFQFRWSGTFFENRDDPFILDTREDMLEISHNFAGDIHNIVWGASYTRDTFKTNPKDLFRVTDPRSFANDQGSAFIEDEMTLAEDLWMTIGYRAQYNEFTHYDWAGRVALVWQAAEKHFLRGSISRSFVRPLFGEEFNLRQRLNRRGNIITRRVGNQDLVNERLIAYELGYRGLLADNLELNIEGFFNRHTNLILRTPDTHINGLGIETYGIETSVNYQPFDWWLVKAFHAYEHQTDENRINQIDEGSVQVWTVPNNKLGLTNRFYIDKKTTLNTQLFWSDTFFDRSRPANRIDPYFRFDVRLGRQIWDGAAEIAFGVKNLTDQTHYEGSSDLSEVPRQVYFQFFCRF